MRETALTMFRQLRRNKLRSARDSGKSRMAIVGNGSRRNRKVWERLSMPQFAEELDTRYHRVRMQGMQVC